MKIAPERNPWNQSVNPPCLWDRFVTGQSTLQPANRQVENLSHTTSQAGSLCYKSSGFRAFAKAGKQLAKLHLDYESLDHWPLEWIEIPGEPLSYVVEKMPLTKDKKSLKVNASLTLAKIPPAAFEYRPRQSQRPCHEAPRPYHL